MRTVVRTIKVTVQKPDGSEEEKRASYKCSVAENEKDCVALAKLLRLDVLDMVNKAYAAKVHSIKTQAFRKHLAGKAIAKPSEENLIDLDSIA